ncbi:hypothetical protein ACFPRL_09640 [Pseudoclavibacter helvolus]
MDHRCFVIIERYRPATVDRSRALTARKVITTQSHFASDGFVLFREQLLEQRLAEPKSSRRPHFLDKRPKLARLVVCQRPPRPARLTLAPPGRRPRSSPPSRSCQLVAKRSRCQRSSPKPASAARPSTRSSATSTRSPSASSPRSSRRSRNST